MRYSQLCTCLAHEELGVAIAVRILRLQESLEDEPRSCCCSIPEAAQRPPLGRPPRLPPQRPKRHSTLSALGRAGRGQGSCTTQTALAESRHAEVNQRWKLAGYQRYACNMHARGKPSRQRSVRFGETIVYEFIVEDSDDGCDASDSASSSDSDSGPDPAEASDREEAKKQLKREQIVCQAIRHIFKHHPAGFRLNDLAALLEAVNVKNFSPAKCGYSSLERFVRKQSRDVLLYDAVAELVKPPKFMAT
eukprot:TRINITY_DN111790_c0_g1_i1.p1 TRINITY_DN111790_c0_g1~~TRINITY_DN111790_c0_g1_i1.p1  ORF type:complete len:249 (+),score=39.61 TRINITY_DN111790_c0_g1_i1:110-856(+)